jgi:hypothetical protein
MERLQGCISMLTVEKFRCTYLLLGGVTTTSSRSSSTDIALSYIYINVSGKKRHGSTNLLVLLVLLMLLVSSPLEISMLQPLIRVARNTETKETHASSSSTVLLVLALAAGRGRGRGRERLAVLQEQIDHHQVHHSVKRTIKT